MKPSHYQHKVHRHTQIYFLLCYTALFFLNELLNIDFGIRNLVAGTTPVTILRTQSSGLKIDSICLLWLTNLRFISLASSVGNIFVFIFKIAVSIFRWSPTKILQPWLSKSKLLRPPLKNLLDKIRKWSNSSNKRRINPRATQRMKEIATEEVIIKGLSLLTSRIQIFFERWGRRWLN